MVHKFPGIRLDNLSMSERVFNLAVTVFSFRADDNAEVIWTSKKRNTR